MTPASPKQRDADLAEVQRLLQPRYPQNPAPAPAVQIAEKGESFQDAIGCIIAGFLMFMSFTGLMNAPPGISLILATLLAALIFAVVRWNAERKARYIAELRAK